MCLFFRFRVRGGYRIFLGFLVYKNVLKQPQLIYNSILGHHNIYFRIRKNKTVFLNANNSIFLD